MLVENKQPLPPILKNKLPINFFLFVNTATVKNFNTKLVKSTFYNSKEYAINYFYKPLSNML